jgi:hypothetical protein
MVRAYGRQRRLLTSWLAGRKEEVRDWSPNISFKDTPFSDLTSSILALFHKGSTTSQYCHRLGTKPSKHRLLGDSLD